MTSAQVYCTVSDVGVKQFTFAISSPDELFVFEWWSIYLSTVLVFFNFSICWWK